MGWGRTLLLGDIGNRMPARLPEPSRYGNSQGAVLPRRRPGDIEDTERDIDGLRHQLSSANRKDMTQDQRLATLETENAELKLYLAALLRLLRQKGTVTEEELRTMVHAIDAEDGRVDWKASGEVI